MDGPGYWRQALFAFEAKEAEGSGEPLSPHPPTAIGCQTQEAPGPSPLLPMACSIKNSSKGAKKHFKLLFNFSFFYLPAQPGAMESRTESWAVFLEMLL